MKSKIIILLVMLASCAQPPAPCYGTEEQVYRCKVLRNQEKQNRMMRGMYFQQSQQNYWDSYNRITGYNKRY